MIFKKIGYAAVVAVAAVGLVIGSAGSSEAAKAKKKAAVSTPSTSAFCWGGAPVCATRGGMKFNYRSACYAANDGAKVVSAGACPAKKAMKAKKAPKKAAKKAAKKATKKEMKK